MGIILILCSVESINKVLACINYGMICKNKSFECINKTWKCNFFSLFCEKDVRMYCFSLVFCQFCFSVRMY